VTAWQALFVPAKTPPEIVRKISADTNTALTDPAITDTDFSRSSCHSLGRALQGRSPHRSHAQKDIAAV